MKHKLLTSLGASLMLLFGAQAIAQISYVIDSVIPTGQTTANLYLSYANHRGTTMIAPRYDTSLALTRSEPANYLVPTDTNGQMIILLDSCVVGNLHYARVTFFGDSAGFGFTNTVTFTMSCNPIAVNDNLADTIYLGQPLFGIQGSASGGQAPYDFSSAGLPTNIVVDTLGNFNGKALVATNSTHTLTATDIYGCQGNLVKTVVSICPTQTVDCTLPSALTANQSVLGFAVSTNSGTPPYTYSWSGIGGINLSSAGNFSGNALALGTQSYTVNSVDSLGCLANGVFTTTVSCASQTLTVTFSSTINVGQDVAGYSVVVIGGVGQPIYSWFGNTVSGVSLDANTGAFTGTVTAAGTYTFTVQATDSLNCPVSQTFTIIATCPLPAIANLTKVWSTGKPSADTLFATGGNPPFAWSIVGLPANLSSAGSIISGFTTASGNTPITITVSDQFGCMINRQDTIVSVCDPITVNSTLATSLEVGLGYNATVSASNGSLPYVYSWSNQPATLNLASNLITGTVTAAGTKVTTYTVTDTYGCSGILTQTYVATCPGITIQGLPDDTVGTPIVHNLVISGGTAPYVSSVVSLPPNWVLANNQVSGTANQTGLFTPTVTVTDFYGCSINKQDMVQIFCNTFALTGISDGVVGMSYQDTIASSDPSATIALIGGTFPSGLILITGVGSGTPDSASTYIYTVQGSNAYGCTVTLTDTVVMSCPTLTVTSTLPDTLYPGQVPNAIVSASGGTAPYVYNNWTGNPVTGLTLSSGGAIGDTVSGVGTFIYTFPVVDANGCLGSLTDTTVVLCSNPVVMSPFPDTIPIGAVLNYTVVATDSLALAITYAVTGSFIPGAILASTSGVVSDTVNSFGTYIFTLVATSNFGCVGTVTDTVVVLCDTLAIDPLQTSFIIGVSNADTLSGSGGTLPYTWSVTGLPPGLSLAGSIISGIPTNDGSYPVVITLKDKYGCSVIRNDTISVDSLLFIKLDSIGSVTATSALAYVSVYDNHDPNAICFVGYGTTGITTFLSNVTLPLGDTNLVFTISGLNPGTTYIVGGRSLDTAGLLFSNTKTFTTKSAGPQILSTSVKNILPESADISVNVSTGGAKTTVRLYCDNNSVPTTLYTYTTSVSSIATIHVGNLNGASTAYYYVLVLNAYGTDTTSVLTFAMPPYNVAAVLLTQTCGSKITAIANIYSNDPGATAWLIYEQGASLTTFANQALPIMVGIKSGTVAISSPNLVLYQKYAFAIKTRDSNGLEDTTAAGICTVTDIAELDPLGQARVWAYGKTIAVKSKMEVEFMLYDCLGREVIRDIVSGEKAFAVATPGVYLYQLRIGDKFGSGKLLTE